MVKLKRAKRSIIHRFPSYASTDTLAALCGKFGPNRPIG
jgi:hypothetical protein